MPKPKNPRVIAHHTLDVIFRNARTMRKLWDGPMHAPDPETKHYVIAPADKQLENLPEAWTTLAKFARQIEKDARDLAEFAERNARFRQAQAEPAIHIFTDEAPLNMISDEAFARMTERLAREGRNAHIDPTEENR